MENRSETVIHKQKKAKIRSNYPSEAFQKSFPVVLSTFHLNLRRSLGRLPLTNCAIIAASKHREQVLFINNSLPPSQSAADNSLNN